MRITFKYLKFKYVDIYEIIDCIYRERGYYMVARTYEVYSSGKKISQIVAEQPGPRFRFYPSLYKYQNW